MGVPSPIIRFPQMEPGSPGQGPPSSGASSSCVALAGLLGGLSNRTTPARVSRFGGVETAPALAI